MFYIIHYQFSVFPATIHVALNKKLRDDAEIGEAAEARRSVVEDKMEKFYSSVKSRLLVGEVIARIEAGSEFSFDFLLLLLLAGIIAFMGLLENSSVVLVASMLVSPIMGPILAGIFGGAIQDRHLTWSGIRHEIYSLIICIIIGIKYPALARRLLSHGQDLISTMMQRIRNSAGVDSK